MGQRTEWQRVSCDPWPQTDRCIFSVGLEKPYRWKDSVQSEAEIRIWVADGIANGLRPWFTKFAGSVRDSRWLPVVADIYVTELMI